MHPSLASDARLGWHSSARLADHIGSEAFDIRRVDGNLGLCVRRYASFYLTRNSLAFTAPTMLKDEALGLDMIGVGGLTSVLPVAYGFSKFLSGVLGARTSPVILLAGM